MSGPAKLSEVNAIRFLRALLEAPAPGEMLDNGNLDAGWCCNEHAIIAGMAFLICGETPLFCDGKVTAGGQGTGRIYGVEPHRFVIVQNRGIFDSSLTLGPYLGLPSKRDVTYSGLAVEGGEHFPTQSDFEASLKGRGKPWLAWYSCANTRMTLPHSKMLTWVSVTPYGEWFSKTFGSQSGVWSRAGWMVANVLKGAPLPSRLNRKALWERILRQPDRDELVSGVIADCLRRNGH